MMFLVLALYFASLLKHPLMASVLARVEQAINAVSSIEVKRILARRGTGSGDYTSQHTEHAMKAEI